MREILRGWVVAAQPPAASLCSSLSPRGVVLLRLLPDSPFSVPKSPCDPAEGWDSLRVSCPAAGAAADAPLPRCVRGEGEQSFPEEWSNPPPDRDVASVGMGTAVPGCSRGISDSVEGGKKKFMARVIKLRFRWPALRPAKARQPLVCPAVRRSLD